MAGNVFLESFRNRWIFASILAILALAFLLALLGSSPGGSTKTGLLTITTVSLTSLGIYLIPLISLMLAYDAIVGEYERGTLLLLLTYPVLRWQIIMGKFIAHSAILALAIGVGYGSVALYVLFTGNSSTAEWKAYFLMMLSSLLLGMIFVALGYLVSVLVKQRSTATGACIGLWLLLVILYDLLLLAILLLDRGYTLSPDYLGTLLLFNPADIFRLFNLVASGDSSLIAGMTGLDNATIPGHSMLFAAMILWLLTPLILTVIVFRCREL